MRHWLDNAPILRNPTCARRQLTVLLSVLLLSCSSVSTLREPFFHSPLTNTKWPNSPENDKTLPPSSAAQKSDLQSGELRARMIAYANSLLETTGGEGGYGTEDIATAFVELGIRIGWTADQGLDALVNRARECNAFHPGTKPSAGDIVLFHNVWDANGNGENDDWLSGSGIVVTTDEDRFQAVVRTGHTPRLVLAWPDGPIRRTADGEPANSFLRVPTRSDPTDAAYLAGQLYAGYIDIETLVEHEAK